MDGYWRAANYLPVGQICLCDNPLLRKPLNLAHIKPRLFGHCGTTAGLNFGRVYRPGGERPALPTLETNGPQLAGVAQWRTRLLNHEGGGSSQSLGRIGRLDRQIVGAGCCRRTVIGAGSAAPVPTV